MASFTVRVNLHNVNEHDSETHELLHREMAELGFIRTIKTRSGEEYQLPPGEFNFVGKKSKKAVLGLAKSAAHESGKEYGILVTQSSNRRSWHGLTQAENSK